MIRTRHEDSGAEVLFDPLTVIRHGDDRQADGRVEHVTTEVAHDGSINVNVLIMGSNTLCEAGVTISYGGDGTVHARQIPEREGGFYSEFNVASDGTMLPGIYHGPYGAELLA
jgi:hypothetical protein